MLTSNIENLDFTVQIIPGEQALPILTSSSPITVHEAQIIALIQAGRIRDGPPYHVTFYSAASFSSSAARFSSAAFASTSSTM